MWLFDAQSRKLIEANEAAVKLYGYTADEMRSMPMEEFQATGDLERFLSQPHEFPKTAPEIWRHRTKSGRAIDVEIAVHDIDYRGKSVQLAVVMDVTGRRDLEEQLRQAQKMEAVGMLAGGVAHDFNNLLTIITGYSQLILNNLPKNDPNRHSAEQIMKAGDRAAALTNQLLAFSRRQVMQPKVLDLNNVVNGLERDAAASDRRRHRPAAYAARRSWPRECRPGTDRTGADEPGGECTRRDAEGRRSDHRDRERDAGRALTPAATSRSSPVRTCC